MLFTSSVFYSSTAALNDSLLNSFVLSKVLDLCSAVVCSSVSLSLIFESPLSVRRKSAECFWFIGVVVCDCKVTLVSLSDVRQV